MTIKPSKKDPTDIPKVILQLYLVNNSHPVVMKLVYLLDDLYDLDRYKSDEKQ